MGWPSQGLPSPSCSSLHSLLRLPSLNFSQSALGGQWNAFSGHEDFTLCLLGTFSCDVPGLQTHEAEMGLDGHVQPHGSLVAEEAAVGHFVPSPLAHGTVYVGWSSIWRSLVATLWSAGPLAAGSVDWVGSHSRCSLHGPHYVFQCGASLAALLQLVYHVATSVLQVWRQFSY